MKNAIHKAYTLVVKMKAKPENVDKLKSKLSEAALIYRKDKETLDWHIMQDHKDPTRFCIIERYEKESSTKIHMENPYWKTFDPYVLPLLEGPMDLTRWNEF